MFAVSVWLSNSIAVAEGILFAGDWEGDIYQFAPDGGKSTFAVGADPFGLACDSGGNLFSVSNSNHAIYKFTPSGSQSILTTALSRPTDIACDGSGNVFVIDSGNIYEFTSSGSQSTIATGLFNPRALACDSRGNLFVTDGRGYILKYTSSGSESTFATGLMGPEGLTCDGSDNLFVTDSTYIYKYTPSGFRSTFATGLSHAQHNLAFDTIGNLFVTDLGAGKIYKITPSGSQSVFASGLHPGDLAFTSVPEPSTFVFLGVGMVSLVAYAWRRRRA